MHYTLLFMLTIQMITRRSLKSLPTKRVPLKSPSSDVTLTSPVTKMSPFSDTLIADSLHRHNVATNLSISNSILNQTLVESCIVTMTSFDSSRILDM